MKELSELLLSRNVLAITECPRRQGKSWAYKMLMSKPAGFDNVVAAGEAEIRLEPESPIRIDYDDWAQLREYCMSDAPVAERFKMRAVSKFSTNPHLPDEYREMLLGTDVCRRQTFLLGTFESEPLLKHRHLEDDIEDDPEVLEEIEQVARDTGVNSMPDGTEDPMSAIRDMCR